MAIEEEENTFSDEEIDEKKHQKLLDKVLSLNKVQQLKKPSRTEPTLKISEFDLVKSVTGKKGSIHLDDLTKVFSNKKNVNIKNEGILKKISNTLPKPLEKPTADRIQRTVAYEKARLELDRWEPIVTSNRVSTNLTFPLPTEKSKEKDDMTSRWKLKTIFDIEMEKSNPPVEEIHIDVEKEQLTMSMKEIIETRKSTAKLRAHQSYEEAKARRLRKIKSKKYHRVQKRAKIKQQLKEFELLQKTDPEEALKRLEEIEKIRAHERFSLRHKSTGKWAKNKQIRAKYDKESRQELAQQLTISKELTQKINDGTDSEDDLALPKEGTTNSSDKDDLDVDNKVKSFVDDYRKYWLNKNMEINTSEEKMEKQDDILVASEVDEHVCKNVIVDSKETNNSSYSEVHQNNNDKSVSTVEEKNPKVKVLSKKKKNKTSKNLSGTSVWDVEILQNDYIDAVFDKIEKNLGSKVQKKLKNIRGTLEGKKTKTTKRTIEEDKSLLILPSQKKRPKIDEPLSENLNAITENVEKDNDLMKLSSILQKKEKEIGTKKSNQNKITKIKATLLDSEIPDHSTNTEEEMNKSSFEEYVTEAFEDSDHVKAEFGKEKSDEIERHKPKDLNLTLPGWGSWGGTGIIPNKRKQRRFIVKAPKKIVRRDDNKGFLIINEEASNKVKEHMVSELPFPFRRVEDFEASIRAPIGQSFVPETAFRKFTRPAVRTKLGATIEPMDKNVLLNKSSK